jgi:hypothetical protein
VCPSICNLKVITKVIQRTTAYTNASAAFLVRSAALRFLLQSALFGDSLQQALPSTPAAPHNALGT